MANGTVTVADVATYVEWLTFMPGWAFTSVQSYESGVAIVRVIRNQPDTDYPPLYNEPHTDIRWARDIAINVSECEGMDDVGFHILAECIEWLCDPELITHEAREFFRVNTSGNRADVGPANWRATFHPHRLSGDQTWKRCMRRAVEMVLRRHPAASEQ